ncbi:MAG: hypothetical protein PHV91_03430 [Bacteroidales bacterium]|jgi:hypothetical protein|nr:hypothetical protein [Bacteroidales bacterium]MDD3299869.1 hypothetical protein [Bacteroidales bacterium]MDD3843021.1 hypothetical protein [Bacteroidales bacterium]MDD4618523.1 hypothetical protein [Bacteroidales bacterium]
MASNYPIEVIPAAAISEAISKAPALIVDTTQNDHIFKSLENLYAQGNYKLYLTRPGINQLATILSRANSCGVRTIVLCSGQVSSLNQILPQKNFSASLISPGTDINPESVHQTLLSNGSLEAFSHIAYQSYRTNPSQTSAMSDKFFEELRLGTLRNDITLAEPLIRNKEYAFLDLNSVRSSDFPGNPLNSPNGLYAEEVCQIARYIGMGQDIKSLFLFGIPSGKKHNPVATELVSEIVWHVVEALSANIVEDPADPSKEELFLKKIVSMGQDGQDIMFVTSRSTGRWWMEIPDIENSGNLFIPCSQSDYATACSGDLPLRWLFFFQKINPN